MLLSVVMPAFNEGPVIGQAVDDVRTAIMDRLDDVELIVADDASTDETMSILEQRRSADARITLLRSDVNRGHGPNLLGALVAAEGEYVFYLDSDRQIDVEDFWTLWNERSSADLVLGIRQHRGDRLARRALTSGLRLVGRIFGARVADPNVPFRLMARPLLDDLVPLLKNLDTLPSAAIALAAGRRGWRVFRCPCALGGALIRAARRRGGSRGRQWPGSRICSSCGLASRGTDASSGA